MLTADQATAVAKYLIAHTPGASGELDHSHISAWQMSCTDAATVVLWRTALEEAPPPGEDAFSAQVDRAVTYIPDTIRAQIHTIYAEHTDQLVRNHLIDWVFFEFWRLGDVWLTDESRGRPLGFFHDLLAQRVRAAVAARLMEA